MTMIRSIIFATILAAVLMPQTTYAGVVNACGQSDAIRISVHIPGVTQKGTGKYEGCYYLKGGLPQYIAGVYNFALIISGFVALVFGLIGGAQWVFAGGNPEKIKKAQERLLNVIVGLMLLFVSYTILKTINPDLVRLKALNVPDVQLKASESNEAFTALRRSRVAEKNNDMLYEEAYDAVVNATTLKDLDQAVNNQYGDYYQLNVDIAQELQSFTPTNHPKALTNEEITRRQELIALREKTNRDREKLTPEINRQRRNLCRKENIIWGSTSACSDLNLIQ